jgi:hypothetical protein
MEERRVEGVDSVNWSWSGIWQSCGSVEVNFFFATSRTGHPTRPFRSTFALPITTSPPSPSTPPTSTMQSIRHLCRPSVLRPLARGPAMRYARHSTALTTHATNPHSQHPLPLHPLPTPPPTPGEPGRFHTRRYHSHPQRPLRPRRPRPHARSQRAPVDAGPGPKPPRPARHHAQDHAQGPQAAGRLPGAPALPDGTTDSAAADG